MDLRTGEMRRTGAMAVLAMVATVLLLPAAAMAHHKPSLPSVNVQPPFSGVWDRFGDAGPSSNHHRVKNGDWAGDLYAPAGTAVQARAFPVSERGAVAYRVGDVRPACRSRVIADGGHGVQVEFHYNGQYVGHAWYLHLDRVQVRKGQWIAHGATLGYTAAFRPNSCYQVNTAQGVHVHFELTSNVHYACYITRRAGAGFNYWDVIGRIGGQYALGTQRPCP